MRKFYKRTAKMYGVGIDDVDYNVRPVVDGKQTYCSIHRSWKSMMTRSYCIKYKKIRPTYNDVHVCDDWHSFMNFRNWVLSQGDVTGLQLDKDLLVVGNKLYSPDTCIFVDSEVNNVIQYKKRRNSRLPVGVSVIRGLKTTPYLARIQMIGVPVELGYFSTSEEASYAYLIAKSTTILEVSRRQLDERVISGLVSHSNHYLNKAKEFHYA